MPKKRKTRKEKIKTENRQKIEGMFKVEADWLKLGTKSVKKEVVFDELDRKYLRMDLTKTLLLSMLVLALELALWKYLSRH